MSNFHPCASCKRKLLPQDKHTNPAASLGEPLSASGSQASAPYPPSPVQIIPSAQASQCHRNRSRSPSRDRKRARNADQARDIAELKGQMAQILKHLSRQQVPPAPARAPHSPAPEHTLASPVVVTEVEQQDVVMSEEEQDVLSLAASWDEESFLRTETQDPDLTQRGLEYHLSVVLKVHWRLSYYHQTHFTDPTNPAGLGIFVRRQDIISQDGFADLTGPPYYYFSMSPNPQNIIYNPNVF
ncbi:hypothetical protein EOD39_6583 [Acipenser ruthenus]|uniref:Uncharacterized protein n=1 Tax=Acipenser ruthenus TaxID=7906 RepID=A0A444U9Q4_ACIRT|nr:hypothetical protein EOD39_6583 [Acipenser ruthenus]